MKFFVDIGHFLKMLVSKKAGFQKNKFSELLKKKKESEIIISM